MSNLVVSGNDVNSVRSGTKIAWVVEQNKKKFVRFAPFVALSRESLELILNLLPKVDLTEQPVLKTGPIQGINAGQPTKVINLIGKRVCVTGTVPNFTREEVEVKMKDVGIHFTSTISTRTSLLVIANKPGQNKVDFAQANNIPTMSWDDFVKTYKVQSTTLWRVCIWGNDDFGFEKDSYDKKSQENIFQRVLKMSRVNKQILLDMGFGHA